LTVAVMEGLDKPYVEGMLSQVRDFLWG